MNVLPPPPPACDDPDALDLLEARVLQVCLNPDAMDLSPAAWFALLAPLAATPPLPQERAARGSSTEARFLLRALGIVLPTAPAPLRPAHPAQPRVGYRLDEHESAPPEVFPLLAACLSQPPASTSTSLADTFADLDLIDLDLWHRLRGDAAPRDLVRAWLQSPGRRLVQQLTVLHRCPQNEHIGATDVSLESLYQAAGAREAAPPTPAWREWHHILPGQALAAWEPAETAEVAGPLRALRLLENPDPLPSSVRGAALLWLLRRAATRPEYRVQGLRRDLREDLPPRLLALLDFHSASRQGPARLEALTLMHAAWLTRADHAPGAVRRAYHVARWIHACLLRSPFHGQDPEVLAARLFELLPPAAALGEIAAPSFRAPLAPGRFGDSQGPDLGQLTVAMAAALHYLQGDGISAQSLRPVPPPLADALRELAAVGVDAQARALDVLAQAPPFDLPSPLLHHAPPLLARALLSRLKVPWIAAASDAVQRETLDLYLDDPMRHAWVPFALQQEAAALPAVLQRRIHAAFARAALPALDQALLGLAVLASLSEEEIARAIDLCSTAGAERGWPAALLDELAREADRLLLPQVFGAALGALYQIASDRQRSDPARLTAALNAMRRLATAPAAQRAALLTPWTTLLREAPFREVISLQRELRRLGVPATPQAP